MGRSGWRVWTVSGQSGDLVEVFECGSEGLALGQAWRAWPGCAGLRSTAHRSFLRRIAHTLWLFLYMCICIYASTGVHMYCHTMYKPIHCTLGTQPDIHIRSKEPDSDSAVCHIHFYTCTNIQVYHDNVQTCTLHSRKLCGTRSHVVRSESNFN